MFCPTGTVLYTEVDDQCDKLQATVVGLTKLTIFATVDVSRFITLSLYLCQTKLITRCDVQRSANPES